MIVYLTKTDGQHYLNVMESGKFHQFKVSDDNLRRLNAECAVQLLSGSYADTRPLTDKPTEGK